VHPEVEDAAEAAIERDEMLSGPLVRTIRSVGDAGFSGRWVRAIPDASARAVAQSG